VSHNGVVDFGTIQCDVRPVESPYKVELLNRTGDTVRIKRIESSCVCVGASITSREIPAGATAAISVTLTPPVVRGRGAYRVYVETDARGQEVIPVTIRLFNLLPCTVQPPSLSVTIPGDERAVTRTLEVVGVPGDGSFRVVNVSSDHECVVVRAWRKRRILVEDSVAWAVDLLASAPDRPICDAHITLKMEGAGGAEERVVSVRVARPSTARALPSSVTIVTDGSGENEWQRVRIVGRAGEIPGIAGVQCDPPVRAVIRTAGYTGARADGVLIAPAEDLDPGIHSGRVRVSLEGDERGIEVPVVVIKRPSRREPLEEEAT